MKKYIKAMSFTRAEALDKISSLSTTLNNHVIKCVVYKEVLPSYLDHWIEEIGIYLYNVNKIKSKTKLKSQDYMNSIFAGFGSDKEDAEANLRLFQIHNKEYPEFELSNKLIETLFEVYSKLIDKSISIFTSGKKLSIDEWIHIVEPILKLK